VSDQIAEPILLHSTTRDNDARVRQLLDRVTSAPRFPPTADLIARYAATTGTDVSALDWYVGLNCFKLAVVVPTTRAGAPAKLI
jgi:aminoglycoside phosphotransferase (APT) family kinase protein